MVFSCDAKVDTRSGSGGGGGSPSASVCCESAILLRSCHCQPSDAVAAGAARAPDADDAVSIHCAGDGNDRCAGDGSDSERVPHPPPLLLLLFLLLLLLLLPLSLLLLLLLLPPPPPPPPTPPSPLLLLLLKLLLLAVMVVVASRRWRFSWSSHMTVNGLVSLPQSEPF